jgi:hypothetical protein
MSAHDDDPRIQALRQLIAQIGHEIRTPMNGVLGLTELALQAAESPSQRRHLEMAVEAGHALLQMVNDLLDFSRLEADKLVLHEEAFNLPELLASTFRSVMPQMRSKGLVVRYDHLGDVHWVRGDVTRLRQIVTNLLGNAVKFTPAGELVLVCETQALDEQRCRATIRVQDTGPGLDPALREHLFEPYTQGMGSARLGGAGLGLSIARGLARAMGGELSADSAPGQGCTFTLTLPFARAADPEPPQAPPPGHAWLVFPNPQVRQWVEQRLQRLHWSTTGLESVCAAIGHVRAGEVPPPLMVVSERAIGAGTDLGALRAALPHTRIHLLVRPDWNAPALERDALALGMALNISPLTPRDLLAMTSDAAHVDAAPAAEPEGDVLIVEDNPVNQIIASEFLRVLGVPSRVVGSGEAALRACLARAPQLVLMDVQMPGMDGRETCRQLRALQSRGELAPFTILALTAHAASEEREACFAAGMDGYIGKPLMLHSLREALARWLPQRVHLG